MFGTIKNLLRNIDDWIYEQFNQNHILFVLTNNMGFSCQAPIIAKLLKKDGIKVCVTTDRDMPVNSIDFKTDFERQLFFDLYIPFKKAVFLKWNLIVNSHLNGFLPKRRGLQVYMHHGTCYGNTGTQLPNAEQHNIYFGLVQMQRDYFERLSPGIFNKSRVFFAIGSPKTDALVNGMYDREKILAELNLPVQPTILITSHWSEYSILSTFGNKVFDKIASSFPNYNVVQTGHPWLWTVNKNTDTNWSKQLSNELSEIDNKYPNALFLPDYPVEPLLSISDMLITDHSSVITMYSLLDRPIVFFNNLDARKNKFGRDETINKYIGASHVFSKLEQLVDTCIESFDTPEKYRKGRQLMRDAFFSNLGSSSKTAADILSKMSGVYSVNSTKWQKIMQISRQRIK